MKGRAPIAGRSVGSLARRIGCPQAKPPLRLAVVLGLALVLSFCFGSLRPFAQDVVVFTDQRSLVVSGHREEGGWVFLRLESGEFAVPKTLIAEIRDEGSQARESAKAAAQIPEPVAAPALAEEARKEPVPRPQEEPPAPSVQQSERPKGPWRPATAGSVARPLSGGLRASAAPGVLNTMPAEPGLKKR